MRTVIIRLFEAAPDTGPVGLRGIVEDLGRGTSEPFNGPLELLDAIERAGAPASEASGSSAAAGDPSSGESPSGDRTPGRAP